MMPRKMFNNMKSAKKETVIGERLIREENH